jgi:uncharacterized protein YqjF (DUF2071 family)
MPTPDFAHRLAMRERPRGLPVMRQRWAGLGFFHWTVDPVLIAERLPIGLHVDTFEGRAWLGVVPFYMRRIRPAGMPPVPWLSWFLELNVRTYVHDDQGNSGVWFFSLDCNQPIAVEIARRSFQLPYEHATMSASKRDGMIDYRSKRRRETIDAEFQYPIATQPKAAEPESLGWFLVERYLLFSANRAGNLFCGRVHHSPYLIEPMKEATCSTEPLRLNGFPQFPSPPDSMISAATVDVTVFPLRRLSP